MNMRACLRLGLAMIGVVACATAEARIVYVVQGNTKAKSPYSSWETASSSIMQAYENAAEDATPENPNEVWIRYGEYKCCANDTSGIAMKQNVIVRGGFNGTETSADQADPYRYPTILHNGKFSNSEGWAKPKNSWQGDLVGSNMWKVVKGFNTFFDPPDLDAMTMYRSADIAGASNAFQRVQAFDDKKGFGRVEFHGLTFTRYQLSAVRVNIDSDDPIIFRQCRFLNIGWKSNNPYFVVDVQDTGIDMEDCEFVSAQSPVYVGTSDSKSPRRTNVISRCRFYTTQACSSTSGKLCCGGVAAKNNVALTIKNCIFDKNISQTSGTGALLMKTYGDVTIENTVIRRGYGQSSNDGGAMCYNTQTNAVLTMRNCRFERCHVKSHYAAAALTVYGTGKQWNLHQDTIENTSFVGNYVDKTYNFYASSAVMYRTDYTRMNFVNCLFEGNAAINSNETTKAIYTTVGSTGAHWNNSIAFINCAFKDNIAGYMNGGKTVLSPEIGPEENFSDRYSFVNTVFENSNANQPSWRLAYVTVSGVKTNYYFKSLSFANCVTYYPHFYGTVSNDFWRQSITNIKNIVEINGAWNRTSNCYRLDLMVSNEVAGVEAKAYTNGAVIARRLATDSPYHRAARPIWKANNGQYYMHDVSSCKEALEKPWVPCQSVYQYPNPEYNPKKPTTTGLSNVYRLTEEEAEAIGLSAKNEPIRDAFGGPRGDNSALGPLNDIHRGLRIGVRGTYAR